MNTFSKKKFHSNTRAACLYMTCRAGAVLHSDIHTHTVFTEDLREAREIMYFRKQNNEKLLTRKFNKGLAAKQRVKKKKKIR